MRRSIAFLAVLAAALAGACDGPHAAAPRTIRLARGFEPSVDPAPGSVWKTDASGRELTLWPEPGTSGIWVECTIDASDWLATAWPGILACPRPLPEVGTPPDGSPRQRLFAGDREFGFVEPASAAFTPVATPPGSFGALGDLLFLRPDEEHVPPEQARFRVFVDRGATVGEAWRVTLGETTAEGLPVWPGTREQRRVDLPPGSVLRVGTAALSLGAPRAPEAPGALGAPEEKEVAFRIRLDGELLLDTAQRAGPRAECVWHRIELPAGGRAGARLEFAVDGPAAVAAFVDPVVGPAVPRAALGRDAPDVLVVLVDTFRADNLTVHGGAGFAPELDRLAEQSAVFERAWSTSSWTLPALSTLLTGLTPPQHGAERSDLRLADELARLPARMSAAGYRTVALTDGSFASAAFGLDRGFQFFEEHWGSLEERLDAARATLAVDDGRPLFLFVHTYRTHEPYRVSDETRKELEGRLRLADAWEAVHERRKAASADGTRAGAPSAELAQAAADLRDLYLGAVRDASRALGRFVEDLERSGYFERGYLVLTSDHGEAFLEHGHIGHGATVFDEIVHVPLVIRGPGLAPQRVREPASLLDLPRTLAALTGVEPDPRWGGRPILQRESDVPLVAFECRWDGSSSVMAILGGDLKYVLPSSAEALAAGELRHAFDLAADPRERRDLMPESGAQAQAELARLRPLVLPLLVPAAAPVRVGLDARSRSALGALGYAGH